MYIEEKQTNDYIVRWMNVVRNCISAGHNGVLSLQK